jgi:hypothetical protein
MLLCGLGVWRDNIREILSMFFSKGVDTEMGFR